jgi:hypothetical protein
MKLSRKLAGLSGVAFVLLSVAIGALAPPPPSLASSGADIVSYYSAHQGGFLAGNYLGAVAILPAFLLVVYLSIAIREAEPEGGHLWLLVIVTNASALTVAMVLFALLQAAAVVAPNSAPPAAKAVSDAANMVFGFSFLPTGAGIAALAWGFLATQSMSRAIGWTGIGVAALVLIASFGTVVVSGPLAAGGIVSLVALLAFVAWLLWISVTLLVTRGAHITNPKLMETGV